MELVVMIIVAAGLYVLGTRQAGVLYDNDEYMGSELIRKGKFEEGELLMPHRVLAVYGWPYWAVRSYFSKGVEVDD